MDVLKVGDDTTREELAEIHEGRARRLMAERCRLPQTWMSRARRAELLAEVNEALDEWLEARA